MHSYYVDLKFFEDPDLSAHEQMQQTMQRLHTELLHLGGRIGISFPGWTQKTLGAHLRLHGSQRDLEDLMLSGWAPRLRLAMTISDVKQAPSDVPHVIVSRLGNYNIQSKARRMTKRHDLTFEEALACLLKKSTKAPYVNLKSSSTGQCFKLFIQQTPVEPIQGLYNMYGFGISASVPFF